MSLLEIPLILLLLVVPMALIALVVSLLRRFAAARPAAPSPATDQRIQELQARVQQLEQDKAGAHRH